MFGSTAPLYRLQEATTETIDLTWRVTGVSLRFGFSVMHIGIPAIGLFFGSVLQFVTVHLVQGWASYTGNGQNVFWWYGWLNLIPVSISMAIASALPRTVSAT